MPSLKAFFESEEYKNMLRTYIQDHQNPVNQRTHEIGIPLIMASVPALLLGQRRLAAALFVGGWTFQLIGHAFEGKAPTFTRDPLTGFLSGPVYFIDKWLMRLGVKEESVAAELGLFEEKTA